jgi:hypothetical protein
MQVLLQKVKQGLEKMRKGLASHQEGGVMRKLARIVTGVFQVQGNHVWARSVTVTNK